MYFELTEEEQILKQTLFEMTHEMTDQGVDARGAWQTYREIGLAAVALDEQRGGAGMSLNSLGIACQVIAEINPGWSVAMAMHNLAVLKAEKAGEGDAGLFKSMASGETLGTVALVGADGDPQCLDWTSFEGPVVLVSPTGDLLQSLDELDELGQAHQSMGLDDFAVRGVNESFQPAVAASESDATWDAIWASVLIGFARGAFKTMVAYSEERSQFGRPLSKFQAVQWMLADSSTELDAAALLTSRALATPGDARSAAAAAYYSGKICLAITDRAIQVHGGYGFTLEYRPQLFWRAARQITSGVLGLSFRRHESLLATGKN